MSQKDKEYVFQGVGLDVGEKRIAKTQFLEYIKTYPHLNKLSNLQLLEDLVFQEAIHNRLKNQISLFLENEKKNQDPTKAAGLPAKLQEQLNSNLNQILSLKERLGLFKEKEELDAFKDVESLIRKFEEYRKENQAAFEVTCPFCTEIFFLKRRTEHCESFNFPFFKDKILCNVPLHKLYKAGKLTKEEYAEVIGTSSDYIDWLDEKWFQKDPSVIPENPPIESNPS